MASLQLIPSVNDILKDIERLQKLYDAFFHKHKNAGNQVKVLAEQINTFYTVIINQAGVLERSGRFFPGTENFLRTIEQCHDFLKSYESLLVNHPNPISKGIATARWAFIEKDEQKLVNTLNLHIQAFNAFTLNTLLEIATHDRAFTQTSQTAGKGTTSIRSPHLDQAEDTDLARGFDNLFVEVVKVQNRQKRQAHYDVAPDLDRVYGLFREALLHTGLKEKQVPRQPKPTVEGVSLRRALNASDLAAGTSLNLAWAQMSPSTEPRSSARRPSLPYTRISSSGSTVSPGSTPVTISEARPESFRSPVPSLISSSGASEYSASPTSTAFRPRTSSRDSTGALSMLALDATFETVVHLKFGDLCVAARSSSMRYDNSKHALGWTTEMNELVEHVCPSRCAVIPFTKHRDIGSPLEVTFIDDVKHQVRHAGKVYTVLPTYSFEDERTCSWVQSLLRKRTLVATFSTEKISTSASGKDGDASKQHVKIWKSLTGERYYLAYFANTGSQAQAFREIPFSFLDPIVDSSKISNKLTVHINDTSQGKNGNAPVPLRERKWSFSLHRAPTYGTSPPNKSLADHRRSSSTTMQTLSDAGTLKSSSNPERIPDQFAKLGAISLCFSSLDDRSRFVAEYEEAFASIQLAQDGYIDARRGSSGISRTTMNPAAVASPRTSPKSQVEAMRATPAGTLGISLPMIDDGAADSALHEWPRF